MSRAIAIWMRPAAKAWRLWVTAIRRSSRRLSEQAATLITCHESFYNDRRAELYELLASVTPADLNRFFLMQQRRGSQ